MTKKAPPGPPEYLGDSSKRFWGQVVDRYLLEAHELKLLEFACMNTFVYFVKECCKSSSFVQVL